MMCFIFFPKKMLKVPIFEEFWTYVAAEVFGQFLNLASVSVKQRWKIQVGEKPHMARQLSV